MPEAIRSSKDQIVLTRKLREELNLREGDRLLMTLEDDHIAVRPKRKSYPKNCRKWRGRLAGTKALQEHAEKHTEEVGCEVCLDTFSPGPGHQNGSQDYFIAIY